MIQAVFSLALAVITYWAGFDDGQVRAHQTIATECARLGEFYVGSTTYECKRKETKL